MFYKETLHNQSELDPFSSVFWFVNTVMTFVVLCYALWLVNAYFVWAMLDEKDVWFPNLIVVWQPIQSPLLSKMSSLLACKNFQFKITHQYVCEPVYNQSTFDAWEIQFHRSENVDKPFYWLNMEHGQLCDLPDLILKEMIRKEEGRWCWRGFVAAEVYFSCHTWHCNWQSWQNKLFWSPWAMR